MNEHKKVEEWADAYLDQHRTRPRAAGRKASGVESSSLEDEPLVRLATKLSGEAPDPVMLERLRRNRERHATFVKLEAIWTIVGVLLLCALGYVCFSAF